MKNVTTNGERICGQIVEDSVYTAETRHAPGRPDGHGGRAPYGTRYHWAEVRLLIRRHGRLGVVARLLGKTLPSLSTYLARTPTRRSWWAAEKLRLKRARRAARQRRYRETRRLRALEDLLTRNPMAWHRALPEKDKAFMLAHGYVPVDKDWLSPPTREEADVRAEVRRLSMEALCRVEVWEMLQGRPDEAARIRRRREALTGYRPCDLPMEAL